MKQAKFKKGDMVKHRASGEVGVVVGVLEHCSDVKYRISLGFCNCACGCSERVLKLYDPLKGLRYCHCGTDTRVNKEGFVEVVGSG